MTRIVVCDTGPLLHLSEAGAIHLLHNVGEILIPPTVGREFKANSQGWLPPHWVKITDLDKNVKQQAMDWVQEGHIDLGEAEAIGLALQINADWLLTDDAKARQFAETVGLEVHGSLGLLIWNVSVGYLDDRAQALTLLNHLAKTSLWISKRVLHEAQKAIIVLLPE
jgi:predicted nucleic acid-binding protein